MTPRLSLLVPYTASSAAAALARARRLATRYGPEAEVLLAGGDALPTDGAPGTGVRHVEAPGSGRGQALRAGLAAARGNVVVLEAPEGAAEALLSPLESDAADAVFCRPAGRASPARAVGALARWVADVALTDPLQGPRAFRADALRALTLTSEDESIDVELVVKLAAQRYRLAEVALPPEALLDGDGAGASDLGASLRRARALLHYATVRDAADNTHEGFTTLERMDGAPNYAAWIGRKFRPYLGRRVLEVGAGIGTITKELEAGRELLIALELETFYVERLRNMFRGKPHVRPYLSGVEAADWQRLQGERLDTIVLSNVLEHIEDDGAAVRNFRDILPEGGRLLVFVPALQALFGAIDEAVGHHRRYTPATLRRVLEQNGFEVEVLEWMNLVGMPGWFLSSVLMRRRSVPPLQLKLYDAIAPWLAAAESRVRLPVGLSLFTVARRKGAGA